MSFAARHGALLILAGVIPACKSDRPVTHSAAPPAAAAPASPASVTSSSGPVTITATDFKLELPATIPAGAVTMQLENHGQQLHHAQLVRLDDGKTVADLAAAMKTEGPPPPWLKFLGGPNAAAPGGETVATTLLTPGTYAVLCLIPGPDGVPHVAKGMIQSFEVTPASASAEASLPAAGDTIRLVDYGFEDGRPFTVGHHTVLVENGGPQQHEIVLLRLQPGKSIKDFGTWAMSMKGPPPAVPIGGLGGMEKGARAVFTADMPPGEYAFICFVPDAKDGKMHFMHGMMKQFTVQ